MSKYISHGLGVETAAHQILRWPREARPGAPASEGDDRFLTYPAYGIIGVFDGIGGDLYGDVAAETTMQYMRTKFERGDISVATATAAETPELAAKHLAAILTGANWAIQASGAQGLGHTTATVAQIMPRDDKIYALWAHIGDSRAFYYDAKKRKAHQLTDDEGDGYRLDRFLGADLRNNLMHDVKQYGAIALNKGDWLILATDGITDEYAPHQSSRKTLDPHNSKRLASTILRHARRAGHAVHAAEKMVENARKNDDATVVALKVIES